jgi:hypothetical protein
MLSSQVGMLTSIVAFNLSAKDAMAVRKEFLEDSLIGDPARPVPLEALVALRPGQAMARLGGGPFAMPLQTRGSFEEPPVWRGEKIRAASSERYRVLSHSDESASGISAGARIQPPKRTEDFLE